MAPFSLYQVNPSPSSAAYMRHWTGSSLVQVMACLLFGAKPLPNQCWLIVNWTPGSIIKWNLKRNSIIFTQMAGVGGWVGCGCVGGGRGRVGVECLLDTWLGIGANWLHKSVWCTLMSDNHMDVILWSVCYFHAYCTMCYIALFICPALSLGSKCT